MRRGMGQCGGMARYGTVRRGVVRCVVWASMMWRGMRHGVVWCGVVSRHGVARRELASASGSRGK
jgi:hypothetical protein